MTSVSPYTPTWDFPGDPAPQDKVNAAALQGQLDLIAGNLAELITALAVSIRDDNTLTDYLVRLRNLHPEVSTLLLNLQGTVATQNVVYLTPVKCATVGPIFLVGTGTPVDGVALTAGDRVLVKDQVLAEENGIYIAQGFVWQRASDLAFGDAISSNIGVIVQAGGTINGDSAWQLRPLPTTTNPDVYPPAPTVGADKLGWFNIYFQFPLPIPQGGTGESTASAARTALGAAAFYDDLIVGDGTLVSFPVTHNLGTQYVTVSVQDITGEEIGVTVTSTTTAAVTLTFAYPPDPGETFLVTVIGISP